MRHSPLRHPVAVLRQITGLSQGELGNLVQKSPRTIQSIELNKHTLSEDLATRICLETGVALAWLLRGQPKIEPWVEGPAKVPYKREHFEKTRAYISKQRRPTFIDIVGDEKARAVLGDEAWKKHHAQIAEEKANWSDDLLTYIREMIAALSAAEAVGRDVIAEYRISKFVSSMREEFGQSINEEFLDRYATLLDKCRAGVKETRRMVKETGMVFWSPFVPESKWSKDGDVVIVDVPGLPRLVPKLAELGIPPDKIQAFLVAAIEEKLDRSSAENSDA